MPVAYLRIYRLILLLQHDRNFKENQIFDKA